MPGWSEILAEIETEFAQGSTAPFDKVRRSYLVKCSQKTGRATIVYASDWSNSAFKAPAHMVSIDPGDIQALMQVLHGVSEEKLDLIIHSPGGGIDSAAALVSYLRSKFSHIRAIVPMAAMSAAGMIACAADEIVMGKHSFLGPSDPQFVLSTMSGNRQVAAQSIIEQFEKAKSECLANPNAIVYWQPILSQYGPDLVVQAERASALSRDYVEKWLKDYMFRGDQEATNKAKDAANWLSNHHNFNSHSRNITRDELRSKGLKITDLENNQEEQDLFLSIFHACTHTLQNTKLAKIVENHMGRMFVVSHA